jgi:hypothetical protein
LAAKALLMMNACHAMNPKDLNWLALDAK